MRGLSLIRNKEAVIQISYLNKQTMHSKSVCLLSFKWQDRKQPTGKSQLKPIMLPLIFFKYSNRRRGHYVQIFLFRFTILQFRFFTFSMAFTIP